MRDATSRAGAVAAALLLATVAGCGFDTGPSLSVAVEDTRLEPTTGDSILCCCRVRGTATNQSAVPVHATLKFEAFREGEEDPIGNAFQFIRDFPPGERRDIDAVGFVLPCSDIDFFELADLDLRSAVPP